MAPEYFYVMAAVSAALGAYCTIRAGLNEDANDLAHTAVLLMFVSALSYAAAIVSSPSNLAQFEQEVLR